MRIVWRLVLCVLTCANPPSDSFSFQTCTWRSALVTMRSYSRSNSASRSAAASCTQWPLGLNLWRRWGRGGRR